MTTKIQILLFFIVAQVFAQNIGAFKSEYHLPVSLTQCTSIGNCQTKQSEITLDSNWRWTHVFGGYQNCYNGNQWDQTYCATEKSCTQNCAIDGVESGDWASPYGVTQIPGGIEMRLVTHGPYSDNIGSRVYLVNGENYEMFKLLNREFSFDVDVSNLPCGLNGALYFVEMEQDGGKKRFPTNKAGARYGTGYCDAQCPHDIKWIQGVANTLEWKPSPTDKNSGTGHYGSCCAELDIWEANSQSWAYTVHPCTVTGDLKCEGISCGDNDKGQRQQGVCDKDGCDFNSYRMGDKNFYGPGASFKVDTTKPFKVVTQFITSDGTDNGSLVEVRRHFVQNGKIIDLPNANVPGLGQYNSLKDTNCKAQKSVFKETDKYSEVGGMRQMGEALRRGLVLVMSIWDDHDANMLWLDSDYPLNEPRTNPGVQRGPCPTSSGKPEDVEKNYPNSSVKYSNIRVGVIGSTFTEVLDQ